MYISDAFAKKDTHYTVNIAKHKIYSVKLQMHAIQWKIWNIS